MFPLALATLDLAETIGAPTDAEHPPTYTFVASTGIKDRNGNIYDVAGWELDAYRKNPVVLLAHQWTEPPVGMAHRVWTETNRLMASISLADTPKGKELRQLIDQGIIRTISAGSLPIAFDVLRDEKNGWPTGVHSHRQELVELSIVTIPANPEAIRTAQAQAQDTQDVIQAIRAAKEQIWTP